MKQLLKWLRWTTLLLALCVLAGCRRESDKVIIYSNADSEAIAAIKATLDQEGFADAYEIQTFGTSELGGKLLIEGTDIEADMVTMSSFYLESAQKRNPNMFASLNWSVNTLDAVPDYMAPITVQEGAIVINEPALTKENLPKPTSIADLANPVYKDHLAVVDVQGSSTAWLMIQALIAEYGEQQAEELLAQIYTNASNHIEPSGSGPLNKVISGEVPIGFGLRHQVKVKQQDGMPVDLIDPSEGNFYLTESVAVVNKPNSDKQAKAQQMSEIIIKKGRPALQKFYPVPLYQGETSGGEEQVGHLKKFDQPLTAELLVSHQKISRNAKEKANY